MKAAFEPNHSVSYQKLSAVTFANLFDVGLDPPKSCLASHSADLVILLPLGGAICCQKGVNVLEQR